MTDMARRGGSVAIVGRPNVGKSTLLNRLLGQKLSITADKPQTTRHRILGVVEQPGGQLALLDTPGIHRMRGARALNHALNRAALGAVIEADVVWFMIAAGQWDEAEDRILASLVREARPVMLLVNKIDRLKRREDLLPFLQSIAVKYEFVEIFPISALKGDNAQRLVEHTLAHLPEGGARYPQDQLTDRSLRFISAEFIREQIMRSLGEEVPYAAAVTIEQFEESPTLVRIIATVWVERDGQKAILIGKGGTRLKTIGSAARQSLEALVERKVFLQLWVKVRAGWQDDPRFLHSLELDDLK
ncbi:GTPase Era [Acidihalobacter ferrooxydans]|uniref:GTPase Era n=1 Tax=Acidihalobacter ferrooxydans TaxID=1765967 RepID=A0A1P8UHJ7_9GAMM|nr:GTPase Era [Acidihalobacter ferrooxydans]APZ43315.1 GTPase Era [Acidihalobacter ferrooxydans]